MFRLWILAGLLTACATVPTKVNLGKHNIYCKIGNVPFIEKQVEIEEVRGRYYRIIAEDGQWVVDSSNCLLETATPRPERWPQSSNVKSFRRQITQFGE